MAGRAATVLAVGWMSVCGGLALATMDHGLGRGADWLPGAVSGHSSVHYKNSDAPYLATRPRVAGQIEGEAAAPIKPRAYWI